MVRSPKHNPLVITQGLSVHPSIHPISIISSVSCSTYPICFNLHHARANSAMLYPRQVASVRWSDIRGLQPIMPGSFPTCHLTMPTLTEYVLQDIHPLEGRTSPVTDSVSAMQVASLLQHDSSCTRVPIMGHPMRRIQRHMPTHQV